MGHHFKFKLLCLVVFHAYPSYFPFSLDTQCKNTEENPRIEKNMLYLRIPDIEAFNSTTKTGFRVNIFTCTSGRTFPCLSTI